MARTTKNTGKPATSNSKDITRWDTELAALAEISANAEANVGAGGSYIKTRGGQLEYNGGVIPGNKMNVVVLAHVLENALYGDDYDADNPSAPICFALGKDEDTLAPHEESTEPQHDACAKCPMNQFGSADRGKGKACKNIRRLALLSEGDLENVDDAEVALIKVPVTSVKNWAGYVKSLKDQYNRPPLAFITELSLVPNAKTQFEMRFKLVGTIDDGELIGELLNKLKTGGVEDKLVQPYRQREEEEVKPARGGRGSKLARGGAAKPAPAKRARR